MERARMLIALLVASIAQVGQAQNILEVSSQEAKKIFGIAEGHRIPLSADRAIEVALSETPGDLPSVLKISISETDRKILETKIKNKEAAIQIETTNEQQTIEKQIAALKVTRQNLQTEMLSSDDSKKGALARKMYANILSESNLQSQLVASKQKLAEASVWKFEIDRIGDVRSVRQIHVGNELVWSHDLADKANSVAASRL